jgi:hypothetical protein
MWLYGIKSAPPAAARCQVALVAPRTARRTGLPLRSRPDAGRAARRAYSGRYRQRRARTRALHDEHQAVTIADVINLDELVPTIDARRRSAPPATG